MGDRAKKLARSGAQATRRASWWDGKGRSDESIDLSPGGTYEGENRQILTLQSLAPLRDPESPATTPENIGPSRDFDRLRRAMGDYVIGLRGRSVLDYTVLDQGTPPEDTWWKKVKRRRLCRATLLCENEHKSG